MTELLTAKDVEVKAFKKVSFGGYSIPEVEDFLNQVADDLEAYALRLSERENRILELEEYVKKQESMTDMIKDALIQARKSAKEMEDRARLQTEQILEQTRQEAEKRIAEANSRAHEIEAQVSSRVGEADRTAEQILEQARQEAEKRLADANAKAQEVEAEVRLRLSEAERNADQILTKAKASAAEVLQKTEDMREETEKRWASLEQDLSLRKKEAAEQLELTLTSARSEARRVVEESSHEVEEYENRLRFLNLQKQQFLKDTVSLLLNFGQMIDKAQQEFEAEMGKGDRYEGIERLDSILSDSPVSSPDLIERFRRNLLEGKEGKPESADAS